MEVVKCLVLNGANVTTDNSWALRWATQYKHYEITRFLVLSGAYIRFIIFDKSIESYIIKFLLFELTLIEEDYSNNSQLYKLLPGGHDLKKVIERIIAARSLISPRLRNNTRYDICVICSQN